MRGVHRHREELDALIAANARDWRLERMPVIDRNLLRMGAFELLHDPAVPTAVALDGVPWVLFAIGACGYLLMLLVEGRDRLLRWGRPVGAAPAALATTRVAAGVTRASTRPAMADTRAMPAIEPTPKSAT